MRELETFQHELKIRRVVARFIASRTYKDYVQEQRDKGEEPKLDRETWEAKYGPGATSQDSAKDNEKEKEDGDKNPKKHDEGGGTEDADPDESNPDFDNPTDPSYKVTQKQVNKWLDIRKETSKIQKECDYYKSELPEKDADGESFSDEEKKLYKDYQTADAEFYDGYNEGIGDFDAKKNLLKMKKLTPSVNKLLKRLPKK